MPKNNPFAILQDVELTELHTHLGSSTTPHFLWELAHEQGIRLPTKDYYHFINSVTIRSTTSQKKYHEYFDLSQLIQSSPYGVEKSVHAAISTAYRTAGVTTIEIKLNPMRRNKGGDHDLDKIILSALTGMKKACLEYPVHAGLIIEMDRRFSLKKNEIIAGKAFLFRKEGVVGIDISGPDNTDFSVSSYRDVYAEAHKLGLGTTIHTGEFTPVKEILDVLDELHPDRIGHGIRSVDDERVLGMIREQKVVLELCPSSNIKTQVVADWDEISHIISVLKNRGVLFTINSDSPELLRTSLRKEYTKLLEIGALTKAEVTHILHLARQSSFINMTEKRLQTDYFI